MACLSHIWPSQIPQLTRGSGKLTKYGPALWSNSSSAILCDSLICIICHHPELSVKIQNLTNDLEMLFWPTGLLDEEN